MTNTQFLTQYDFTGDADELIEGLARSRGAFDPSAFLLHVVVRRPDGITVYDLCPTEADAVWFRETVAPEVFPKAGLPEATITPLGLVETMLGSLIAQPVS